METEGALRRGVGRGRLSIGLAVRKLAAYFDLSLTRYEHEAILRRALGLHDNFTVYDATYVALAEALGAPLLTSDRRLAAATRDHTAVPVLETG